MRRIVEAESSSMLVALRVLRARSPWMSSLACSTFSCLFPDQPFPPWLLRFSVSKMDRAFLATSKKYEEEFCRVWRVHHWVTILYIVSWYYNDIWIFSWTVNAITENLLQSPLSSFTVREEMTNHWYLIQEKSTKYLVRIVKLDRAHQTQNGQEYCWNLTNML